MPSVPISVRDAARALGARIQTGLVVRAGPKLFPEGATACSY